MNFENVHEFEDKIAQYFGAPYAVAVDCCTHGIELCLRYTKFDYVTIPNHTYLSVPFTAEKLGIKWDWKAEEWEGYYYLGGTNIIDAAVLWKQNGYIPSTFMVLSFQFQKHLSLGRGGMILLDDLQAYYELKKMSYDGREPNIPWREQNITTMGYHYYMTPETALLGLNKLDNAKLLEPKKWTWRDYPDLKDMEAFKWKNENRS